MGKLVFSHGPWFFFFFLSNARDCLCVGALRSRECHTETIPFTKIHVPWVSFPGMVSASQEDCAFR